MYVCLCVFYLKLLDSTLILDLFLKINTIPFTDLVYVFIIFYHIFISFSCFSPEAYFIILHIKCLFIGVHLPNSLFLLNTYSHYCGLTFSSERG